MDRNSVENGFSIAGASDRQFIWSDDDRCLLVSPSKKLLPWTSYRWSLKSSAKGRDGVPLVQAVSACFVTDFDKVLPCVKRIYPAIFSNGRWLATGGTMEQHFGPGQGIVIEFNKAMADNAINSIRFDPSLAGRCERISETTAVFIPNRDPQPEIFYTLIISGDAQDAGGLKIGEDFRLQFMADIPYLRILSISADGSPLLDTGLVDTVRSGGDLNEGAAWAIPVDVPGGDVFRCTIHFSLPIELEARQDMPRSISLIPFFPDTLPPIALRFASWLSHDRLRMEWEGLKPGAAALYEHSGAALNKYSGAGQSHLYRLNIPGGRGGIETGSGMYLRENLYLILEAQ